MDSKQQDDYTTLFKQIMETYRVSYKSEFINKQIVDSEEVVKNCLSMLSEDIVSDSDRLRLQALIEQRLMSKVRQEVTKEFKRDLQDEALEDYMANLEKKFNTIEISAEDVENGTVSEISKDLEVTGNNEAVGQIPQSFEDKELENENKRTIEKEAKMEEMREEVRRREDRVRQLMQQQQQQQQQLLRGAPWALPRGPTPRPPHPQYHMHHPGYGGGPPPPAPKPRPQIYSTNQRPPGYPPENLYEAGGMGGPPPRMQQQPPPVVSYRYGPSGYPPRGEEGLEQKVIARPGMSPRIASPLGKPQPMPNQNSRVAFDVPPHGVQHDKKEASNLMSPSPWEREEKEKISNVVSGNFYNATHTLHKQRQEEARRARDDEIRELESRQHLTPPQEDRLRALRLEQEFQRRAEELHGEEEDDDDEELLDRAETRERKLKIQEDLERARLRRLEWEVQQSQAQVKMSQQMGNEDWKRQQQSLEEQEGRLRQLRIEEVQRKRELEVAKSAEEKLLREARRRQDEFKVPNNMPQHQIPPNRPNQQPPMNHHMMMNNNNPQHITNHQPMPNYPPDKMARNDSNHSTPDVPPPLPTSPPPMEPSYQTVYSQKPASMRFEKQAEPPAPPARKSSYEITNQMSAASTRYVPSSMRNNCDNGAPPKKVSFHESSEVVIDTNGNNNNESSYTLDDIHEALSTPHNSQNLNTYNPGNTPGVIGSQEVYRGPRQRIEAERTQQGGGPKGPVPEKLTFKEKMKMFAQEVGEQESPKDKVKISRAQRDIETNLNGS